MSLLDIGCGPGSITLGFSSFLSSGRIIGVDSSAAVIEEAQAALASASNGERLKNVTFQTASVFALPFPEDTFDVVYSSQMFPHLSDPVAAFREIHRVLKPGGILATRDADAYAWFPSLPGLELYNDALARKLKFGGATFPAGREMHGWARRAGFAREGMKLGVGGTVHSSREEREWWAGELIGGLERGKYREKLVESGTREGEIDSIVKDLRVWVDEDDGWYAEYDCENIYRKGMLRGK